MGIASKYRIKDNTPLFSVVPSRKGAQLLIKGKLAEVQDFDGNPKRMADVMKKYGIDASSYLQISFEVRRTLAG